MEKLWAPWRLEYIKQNKTDECIFCTLPRSSSNEEANILYKGRFCFVIMNIYPYSNGHLMVSPYNHINCITKLTEQERNEMSSLTQKCVESLRSTSTPDGFNIGMNIGKAAGAGFDEHIHNHIVPRWLGDTNFMPVLSDVRIIPEHIKTTYKRLSPFFQKLAP